jgi:NTE family protein
VLSGAGARGAYEAGALSVFLPLLLGDDRPRLVLGASAGALNAAMLVSYLDQGVEAAAAALLAGWRRICPSMIFATPRRGILRLAPFRRRPPGEAPGLLDTRPLRETLALLLPDERFAAAVKHQTLDAVAISASSVAAGGAVIFIETTTRAIPESGDGIEYVPVELGFEHLMASSAFPLAFPSQWVDGDGDGKGKGWYIDGGVHLNTPLKPAVKLGADRILAVGATSWDLGLTPDKSKPPNVMDGSAQILQALMVDAFRWDLGTLERRNRRLRENAMSAAAPSGQRVVEFCVLNPSDGYLSEVAAQVWPSGLLRFLRSLGGYGALGPLTSQRQLPGQFLSYLCFDQEFISAAIERGIRDAKEMVESSGGIPWMTEWPPDPS